MEKDFDRWNKKKKKIEHYLKSPNFREGQIWWCSAGLNIGHEIDGKNESFERPFYILKKCSKTMFIGIPCTSQNKIGSYMYYLKTYTLDFILNFSQIKTMSSGRLLRKVINIDEIYQKDISDALIRYIRYVKRKPTQ